MPELNFEATPTAARFMKSQAFGRLIAGPVGSGKTTACIVELLRRAIEQKPAADGIRYTHFAIVRQTLKQLRDTVLQDVKNWCSGLGEWKVAENVYNLSFGDVRSRWVFIPLEDAADQGRLLSMQLTGAFLSECIDMNYDVLAPLTGRLGRYPSGQLGTPTWHGWIADTNMPVELSPWHKLMTDPPPNVDIFTQPSGLSPEAENLNYLVQNERTIKLPLDHPERLAQGRRYYERFIEQYGEESDWCKRYVHAQYGDDPSGMAVFKASFKPNFHIVDKTLVIPGYPIIVGQDFGRNPWSLICQADHMGRLLIHEEVPANNIGLEKHVNEHLRPRLLTERYLGHKVAVVGDPSGIAKGSVAEESCFDALKRMGLPAFPASTNEIETRLRSVEALLSRQTNGGPTLLINRQNCPMLIRAMSGGYRFTKTKQGAARTKPDKNDKEGFSHVADALQYVCLVVHGGVHNEIARRLTPRTQQKKPRVSAAGWT